MLEQAFTICMNIIDILDKEYSILKAGQFEELPVLNDEKEQIISQLQNVLAMLMQEYKTIPPQLSDKINDVQNASTRNSAALKTMMDASRIIVNAIEEAHYVHETGGTYTASGFLQKSTSSVMNRNFGSV